MLPLPDHVAVRLVAEDGHVLAADRIGDPLEIVLCGDSARRIVRRIEEDRLGRFVFSEKPLDLGYLRPELVRLQQRSHDGPRPRRSMFGR